jgi:hypothetical protein
MNEVLFFSGAILIIGLSYYLGHQSGIAKKLQTTDKRIYYGNDCVKNDS